MPNGATGWGALGIGHPGNLEPVQMTRRPQPYTVRAVNGIFTNRARILLTNALRGQIVYMQCTCDVHALYV